MAGPAETLKNPRLEARLTFADMVDWLRTNLFGGVWNSLLTILALALLIQIIPPLIDWFFLSAVWTGESSQVCAETEGACWLFVNEKYRLILFGRYPYDEQWRPLLGIVILIMTIALSCNRNFWRAWLGYVWLAALAAFFFVMWGGLLGLRYVPSNLWGGLPLTLLLSVIGIVVAFPVSILLALGRRSDMPAIKAICIGYIELIRGVPLISLLFMASFMLPLFMPEGTSINEVLRAQVAIIMFTSAYLAEVLRGGLQALTRGQYEAADALGLSYWQKQYNVILPQAIRISIPPIVNSFISMFKDTSLVAIVSLTDLLLAARQAIADPEWRRYFVEGYVFISIIYWCFCFFMSKYSQHLERILYTGHKRT